MRWSRQRGSVYLLDQKFPITYQRVRDQGRNADVPLATYLGLQQPRQLDEGVLPRVLLGLSYRRYQDCATALPEAFGLSASSVSRRFIWASAQKLRELQERRLGRYDLVAVVIDGKAFQADELAIALGSPAAVRRWWWGHQHAGIHFGASGAADRQSGLPGNQ